MIHVRSVFLENNDAILKVSDRRSRGEGEDLTGKFLIQKVESEDFPGLVVRHECVPDEVAPIKVRVITVEY